MKMAPSIVVDEPTARRLKFVSLLAGNVGVLPQEVVDRFVTNDGCGEIPTRLLKGFCDEVTEVSAIPSPEVQVVRPRIEILRETLKPCTDRTVDEQIVGMQMMFKMLEWTLSTTGLIVPERRKGFDRLLVVSDKLTNNLGFEACDASFPSWRYSNDLDISIPTSERYPTKNGTYAVWFRDCAETDEELENLSADQISKRGLKTITTLEREVYELVYFMETGNHLDVNNITLCSGSRDSGGYVPDAYWSGGGFGVSWRDRDFRRPSLRSREAVSL